MKYAVLIEESVNIEGDERSRTNPGHGYPAHTMTYTRLQDFDSEKELLDYVKSCSKYLKYRTIRYEPVEIVTEVKVKIAPVMRS